MTTQPITRENCETVQRFEHKSLTNADKTPIRAKRNGKTQTWKTRPERFRIPVKHGIRDCFYIQNFSDEKQYMDNASNWIAVG